MEVENLEENTVVGGKEDRSTSNYVISPMNIYFGMLSILQKVLTNNWQLECGALTLTLLGFVPSETSSKPHEYDLLLGLLVFIFTTEITTKCSKTIYIVYKS